MKYILILLFAAISVSTTAQTKTKAKKTTSVQKTKSAVNRSSQNNSVQSIKDRIDQRLKDSATAATAKNTGTPVKTSETVNGITINQNAYPNSTTTNNGGVQNNNNNQNGNVGNVITNNKTAQGNNQGITTNNSQVMQQGNMNNNTNGSMNGNAAGGIISNNPIANKPVTNEQSQYNSSDLNRNQLNVINQNQNASAAQNPASKSWGQNTIGETQWGQNQVGENQWTVPNQVSTVFTNEFPTIRGATWSRDNSLNNFTARYKEGDNWTTSTYNSSGIRTDTRTEFSVTGNLPAAITTYKSKQNLPVDFTRISKVQRPGKADVYEVRLNNGKLVYLSNEGVETAF